ncbi:MAG: pantetheine-phosphate adenylyltransferase [Elusimicrobiota bacterium]|nr:pantetheine-phosphate adenylyltransferase [Endomicrobiia bacterium]MDW8165209.1 pantetheine-phosphate adenylyltransferase [Elusimicrobiota bacterium]
MRKIIYPGSFDPPTNGHVDLILRASKIFDFVIVAILNNPNKNALFSLEERIEMLQEIIKKNNLKNKVEIDNFNGLLVDYLKLKKCNLVLRGLRVMSDFEYEFQMILTNRKMFPEIETIYLMPDIKWIYLSSSLIKEIASFGGDISEFVPKEIIPLVRRKFNNTKK